MARLALLVTVALAQREGEGIEASPPGAAPFELYSNFDISHLIQPEMNWYELLDIRQQLRRPSLAFYVDKVQYKARLRGIGVDIPEIYYVRNVEPGIGETALQGIRESIREALDGRAEYVAKPTHMSCSDGVFVVKDGWNIYPRSPARALPAQVAATLAGALRTRSSLLGESWALHQVPPGVIVEERISAGGDDDTAALEFKTIVIWGRVWAADVRRGTETVQALGRNGRDLLDKESLHPRLASVDWPRVRGLAERLGAHKDCFRVDIFVSPRGRGGEGTELRYQVNEVEFYITSSLPMFDEAARLWLEGYNARNFVLVPNLEVGGPYADMLDLGPREERALFAELKTRLGWTDFLGRSRSYGSLAPRHDGDAAGEPGSLGLLGPRGNASDARPSCSPTECGGEACCSG